MNTALYESAVRSAQTRIAESLQAYLPTLVGAATLFLLGWGVAWVLKRWSTALARRLDPILQRSQADGVLHRIGLERPVAEPVGRLVFWMVMVFVITATTEALGLPVLAAWLAGVAYFVPRLAVALLIVLGGWLAGNVVANLVTSATGTARIQYGPALGRIARIVTVLVAVLVAIDEVGLDTTVLTSTTTVLVASVLGGFALAFGLGAGTTVGNILGAHYFQQVARVGQTIRLGEIEGEIVAITPTTVVLRGPMGRVNVPAKQFSELVSTVVTGGA